MSRRLFCDQTTSSACTQGPEAVPTMRPKQDDDDRFGNEAPMPGAKRYPNGVVSVTRPRYGHDY